MDRTEAARILGVPANAGEAQVRTAFRNAAKTAHPDSGQAANSDPVRLKHASEARDVLLSPEPEPESAPASNHGRATAAPEQRKPPERRKDRSGVWVAVAAAIFGLVVFGLVAIVAVALFFGAETQRSPTVVVADCVTVTATTVDAVPCSAPGAQTVVSPPSAAGSATCPTGTNTLVTGDLTYCLKPVTSPGDGG